MLEHAILISLWGEVSVFLGPFRHSRQYKSVNNVTIRLCHRGLNNFALLVRPALAYDVLKRGGSFKTQMTHVLGFCHHGCAHPLQILDEACV